MRNGPSKRGKRTLYFRPTIIEELAKEANRHDRSVSWLLQRAWKLARQEIKSVPARRAGAPAPADHAQTAETDSATNPQAA
ncbi:MAG TPA: TIGR04563 family protein [Polyangia bacterium]|nr:TIGR04563 family protein [Polyangia bacterium]